MDLYSRLAAELPWTERSETCLFVRVVRNGSRRIPSFGYLSELLYASRHCPSHQYSSREDFGFDGNEWSLGEGVHPRATVSFMVAICMEAFHGTETRSAAQSDRPLASTKFPSRDLV